MTWMKRFAPEYASTMTYDAYLDSPDEFTRIPTLAGYVPMHRIAMNDPAGTEYYVSAKKQRHRSENRSKRPHSRLFRLHYSQPVLLSAAHLVDPVFGFHRLDRHAHGGDRRRRRNLARGAQASVPSQRRSLIHTLLWLDEVAPLWRPDFWLVFDLLDPERNDPYQHLPDPRVVERRKARRKQWRGFHYGHSRHFPLIIDDERYGARDHRRPLKPPTAPDRKPAECHRKDPAKVRAEGIGTYTVQRRALLPCLPAAHNQ